MKRALLIVGLLIGAGHLNSQTKYSKEVEDQIKQVENNLFGWALIEGKKPQNLEERMAHFKVKGLSIAVVDDYKVVWAKGYGWADEKEKRPVTPETLFEPGSISKSLNGVGILKLVQDKKLDLSTDINTYLKSWKFPYDTASHNKKITLVHLLSHSAGLTVHGFPGYDRKAKMPTIQQVLDGQEPANTPAVRSEFEPGLRFQYSGGGTTISQLIISDVTGQPYDQFMYENVLKPMGMVNSSYSQPPHDDKLNLLATAYHEDGNEVENKFHVYPEQGAAGLWMTPTDLCNYIIETQLSYDGKSSKVLSPEMTKLRLTPYIDNSPALGVFIEERNGAKYFQHGAGNEGFCGQYYGSLKGGKGMAIFLNTDNPGTLLQEVLNSVASVYKWAGFSGPVFKKEIVVADSILKNYTGLYRMVQDRFVYISKKEDGYYQFADGITDRMIFTSETDYFNMCFASEKHFIKDKSGKVSGYLRKANGTEMKVSKIFSPDTVNAPHYFFYNAGGKFFEDRNFDEAIRYYKRGLELYPNTLSLEGDLAHSYLFIKDYDSALKIYKAHLNEKLPDGRQWVDMIKQDFVYLKNNKYDKTLMDRVFADLKWEMPSAYKN